MNVSIVIPTYNRKPILEKCLYALENQKLNTNISKYEVVVVDDGSNDQSVEKIKSLKKDYKNLRLISLQRDKNRELGETRNISIREAKGEYVLLHIDADDLWEPYIPSFVYLFHKLEKLIKFWDGKFLREI